MKRSTRFLHTATFLIISTSAFAQSTWNTTTGNWNTAGNWDPSGVPASATTTQLVFNASGTTSYTATNNIGARNLNKITVNNTGSGTVTIAASSTSNTLTFGGTNPTLDITGIALFTGRMAGSATVTKIGSGTFIHDSNNTGFTGILNINAGTFINRATTNATTEFRPSSIVVNNGGTYQFGENTTGDPNLPNSTYITVNTGGLVVFEEGETFGGFHLQGGTIDLEQGSTSSSGTSAQSWTSGILTGSGASARNVGGAAAINKTTVGTVSVTGNASISTTTGGLNIQEGTIAMEGAGNLGTANVTLGSASTSGIFEYQGTSASRAGTFAVNAGGGSINVTNANANLTLSGALSGDGTLSKLGAGTVSFTGALGGTGNTNITAGGLRVNPVSSTRNYVSSAGTSLIVNGGIGDASFTAPSVNLSGTSTLHFEIDSATVSTAPLMIVSGTDGLVTAGTPTLRFTNAQPMANGLYTLIDYTGTGISSGFGLSLQGRTLGSLVYDTTNTKIDVEITGTDSVKWTGSTNTTWDLGSSAGVGGTNNWQLVTAGTATNFIDTDTILFDDTATNFTVDLTATALPESVVVNASNDYTFSGSGKISGATGLTKSGTGKLTISTNNDYTGITTINAGTVSVGSESNLGGLAGGNVVLNGGTLESTATFAIDDAGRAVNVGATNGTINTASGTTLTLNNTMTGSGTLTKDGSGTLVLQGNGHSGNFIINAGTLRPGTVDNGLVAGSATVTINSSGILDLNGFNEGIGSLLGTGTVTNNAAATTARIAVEPTENSTFDGLIVNGSDTALVSFEKQGAFTIKLTNSSNNFSGTIAPANSARNTAGTVAYTIDLDVGGLEFTSNGALGVAGGDIYLDGADAAVDRLIFGADNITLDSGRQLVIDNFIGIDTQGFTGTIAGAILGDDGSSGAGGNDTFRKQGTGTLVITGTTDKLDDIFIDAGTLRAENALDIARVTIATDATLQFGNANATGDINGTSATVVNNGTVNFNRTESLIFDHAISGSGAVLHNGSGVTTLTADSTYTGATTINAGSLIVNGSTGTSAFTVDSGATLGGSGTIGGNVTVSGTHAPGNSPGTQNVTGDLAYNPGSVFQWEITTGETPVYDQVIVGGTLTGSGATFNITSSTPYSDSFWASTKQWTDVFNKSYEGIFSTFSGTDVASNGLVADRGRFSITGSTLTWTAVPEASNLLIGGLVGLGLLSRRRKQA